MNLGNFHSYDPTHCDYYLQDWLSIKFRKISLIDSFFKKTWRISYVLGMTQVFSIFYQQTAICITVTISQTGLSLHHTTAWKMQIFIYTMFVRSKHGELQWGVMNEISWILRIGAGSDARTYINYIGASIFYIFLHSIRKINTNVYACNANLWELSICNVNIWDRGSTFLHNTDSLC